MARQGILLNDSYDLDLNVTRDNDGLISGLQIGETDIQNVDVILRAAKGEIKEYPLLGVGAKSYLKSVGKEKEFCREVTVQLSLDGYDASVSLTDGNLSIEV
jgi:hypothetical protein